MRAAHGSGVRLRSVFRSIYWPPEGPLQVECRPWGGDFAGTCDPAGVLPDESCECGIYGLRMPGGEAPTRDVAAARLREELLADPFASGYRGLPQDWIVGIVAGWGRVVIAERGWRAEYARPVALFRPGPDSAVPRRAVEVLGAEYAIPILS